MSSLVLFIVLLFNVVLISSLYIYICNKLYKYIHTVACFILYVLLYGLQSLVNCIYILYFIRKIFLSQRFSLKRNYIIDARDSCLI